MRDAPLSQIPVHLITGFLGSGKSTLIRSLIGQKPAGETWAILINEFGRVGIDQAMFEARDDLVIKGLPGGCLCCQLAFVLQATLVNLVHRHRPDRLIIEPSGLGHPAGLLDVLRGEAFRDVLDVCDIIAVLDPRRLDEPRARDHETFRDQLAMADAVVLTLVDLASPEQVEAAHRHAKDHWPARKWVAEACRGELPVSLLSEGGRHGGNGNRRKESRAHTELRQSASRVVILDGFDTAGLLPGQPVHGAASSLGYTTLGWRWHPADRFMLDRLTAVLGRLPAGLRVKGVLNTDAGWTLYNRSDATVSLEPSAWRQDSRLEVIGESGTLPDAAHLERELQACRC
ncbi:CobW family GTP-binding protein [Billgrantia endophytica]|uniref:GTP-binding protein n=1 Tax=Billgrantia endophytica TaxID=2033802 RepID=A0A2N7UAM5_9GAMM|nr:GTP-binding protein [Halomonas endophytica]PMR77496.1 GTP-binding protein [Halomonas endophytica]